MIQLKIKKYTALQKLTLATVLSNGMEITCEENRKKGIVPVSDCRKCKDYIVCHDITNAIKYLIQ